jgi:hypothetical protein
MGFNSAFKGLNFFIKNVVCILLRQMIYHKQFADAVGIHTFQSQKSHEIAQSPTRLQTKDDNPLTLSIGHPLHVRYTTVPPNIWLEHTHKTLIHAHSMFCNSNDTT